MLLYNRWKPSRKIVFAGEAEFTVKDIITKGMLDSNQEAVDIYYHPEYPEFLLMKTHWFTSGVDDREIRHDFSSCYDSDFSSEEDQK